MTEDEHVTSEWPAEGFANQHQMALAKSLQGYSAIFRIGFRSMLVEGMPDKTIFAGAVIEHTLDLVMTNRTLILQQPGLSLTWIKDRDDAIEIGEGIPKFIFHVPFTVSENLVIDFGRMRDRALSAAGMLSAVLDERVALEELFQDVLLIDQETDELTGTVDAGLQVRSFMPRVVNRVEKATFESHEESSTFAPEVVVAARWYLRAAQASPGPDAIVFFWIALECLVSAEGKKVVNAVENALEAAGLPLGELGVSVGKLYGLRADIVHKGVEDEARIRMSYYVLERITRVLLRHKADMPSDWPAVVDENNWPEPVKSMIERLRSKPRTFWRRHVQG